MGNLYAVLGVGKDATLEEIKAAYRQLAQRWHPDRPDGDGERFKAIAAAYDVLGSPEKRKRYDETGSVDNLPDIEGAAINVIARLFDGIIQDETFFGDIIKTVSARLESDMDKISDQLTGFHAQLKKINGFEGRVGVAAGDNLFKMVLDSKKYHVSQNIKAEERDIEIVKKAISMLSGYADHKPTKHDSQTEFERLQEKIMRGGSAFRFQGL